MKNNPLSKYLTGKKPDELDPGFIAYLASLTVISEKSPDIARYIVRELADQRLNLKLIASENFLMQPVQWALTDKYVEVILHRFYAGCDNVDEIEETAAKTACRIFGSDHAYCSLTAVQMQTLLLLGYSFKRLGTFY